MSDILLDHHPIIIAELIRSAIGDQRQKDVAKTLDITPQYLNDILQARRSLSPDVAARLHRIGLDGRTMYINQERRRYEIAHRYEIGEIERQSLLMAKGVVDG